jgi:hypothetical protein
MKSLDSLEGKILRMERTVSQPEAKTQGMQPHYADPVVVEWAQFLLDGGPPDDVPEEFREEAETLYEAAKILEELHAQYK